ncbi:unnamed protein product [Amoebophrya sp. A25]|nr:unnamed protein product [Amoebophrya sp. A25]|eukprot:GSA25T00027817001.1
MTYLGAGYDVAFLLQKCVHLGGKNFMERTSKNGCLPLRMGAYQVGVEVYGDEWSFLFYNDVVEDPTVTGCNRVQPREHPDFSFRTSIYMGRTPLGAIEVSRRLLVVLMDIRKLKITELLTEIREVAYRQGYSSSSSVSRLF